MTYTVKTQNNVNLLLRELNNNYCHVSKMHFVHTMLDNLDDEIDTAEEESGYMEVGGYYTKRGNPIFIEVVKKDK